MKRKLYFLLALCWCSITFGQVVTTFAGSGTSGAVDATGTAASFNQPTRVALDASGNVYVADKANHKIRKVTAAGAVTTFAGSGIAGAVDGTGAAASFDKPSGVAVDVSGNVYVADWNNHKIRKITPAGVVTTFAGSGTIGSADGTGTAASFSNPEGLAVDASGNVYVADADNHKIRKITAAGVVTTLAGSGTAGAVNGTGTAASFNLPEDVALDALGNVYVADYGNNKIRKITVAGVVTTFAGSGIAGTADGTSTTARFKSPYGATVDASGNVYVADAGNNNIRKITSAGVVTTLAGSGIAGAVDATGTAASFSLPIGVAVGGSGNNLYVADFINNKIRKIAPPANHLNFDGVDDYVNCGNSLNTVVDPLNTMTVEAWVKPSTNSGLGVIVGNYANSNQSEMQFLLRRDNNNYAFWVSGNSGVFKVVNATNAVAVNTWQHIAGVWNGSDLKIYVNGVLLGTTTGVTESSFATTSNSIMIGNNQAGTGAERFTGSIDEIRIWNSARTVELINGSKECELQGTETGLIAYYKFNQGFDASNNTSVTTLTATTGPTGTLTNFTLTGATSNWLAGSPVTTGSIVPSVATVTTPVTYAQGSVVSALTGTTGANGTGLIWYTTATGAAGSATAPTPSTASVGSTSYWVSSINANGCESARVQIVVNVVVVNNECPNAINLTIGSSSFSDFPENVLLTTATNSGTPAPTCGNFQGGDVWYTVTVPASGNIVIETNGAGIYDTGLEVYTGACGALSLVSCDDNNGNGNYSKIVLLGQTPGTVLRIRVWENSFGISNAQFQVSAYDYVVPATHLNFDGTDDVVNLGSGLTTYFTGKNAITIEAWVRPETNAGFGVIIGNYSFPTNTGTMQVMLRREGTNYSFYIDTVGAPYTSITASNSVILNTWQHIVGTWDGSTMKIYVNGTLINSVAKPGSFESIANSFVIGTNAINEIFKGSIDEVRIWNIALSPADITNTMNCEAQSQPELVAYYKFNQGNDNATNSSTTSLTDSSGNNYSGTLTNFALIGATSNWKSGSPITTGNTCATLGISDVENSVNLKIYPNPSTGIFAISLEDAADVIVYDMLGKVIYTNKLKAGDNRIDISNHQSGIYLLNVKTENGSTTQKVMKE